MKSISSNTNRWRSWGFSLAAKTYTLVVALVLAAGAVSATTANFCVNPGFEDGTATAAPPWSLWGGAAYPPYIQGAQPNPHLNADNPSPRVWGNFNNPTYVNVAAQNNMSGVWLIPGTTYHIRAQYYVPSSEVKPGVTPRAGIYLSMMNNPPGQYRVLDPRYPDAASNPVSASITNLDQWVTFDFDWVNPGTVIEQVNYGSFRLYGGDGTALSLAATPNPGGYFDNCQISSTNYTGVISGLVKDSTGPLLAGATVTLDYNSSTTPPHSNPQCPFTTLADGAYSLADLIPGETYTVTVSKKPFYSDQTFTATATAVVPDVFLVKMPTHFIRGTVSGLPAGQTATVTAVGAASTVMSPAATALDGTYSLEVLDGDTYAVAVSKFPLGSTAQSVTVSGADVTGINFSLTDGTLVWYKFDGDANDSSAWGKNGILNGAAVIVPHGRVGGSCLSTVAGNGGVVVPMLGAASGDAPLLDAYTMSAWVRCTTSAEWQTLYADPGWEVNDVNNPIFSQSSQMLCSVNGTTGTDHWYPAPWDLGQWHFMTVVYDSVAMTETFYFDGVKIRTDTFTVTVPVHWEANAGIGCFGTDINNRPFCGEIDDFRICGIAAADADVAALYASYPPLVTHTITATTDAGTTLSPVGAVSVMHGYDQTFTVSANLGYRITSVLVDGVAQTLPVASYTFTNVATTHTIAVTSVAQPTHSVAGKVTDAAGVAISGASVYISGSPSASVTPLFTVTTAPDGTYSKSGVPEGTVYVSAGAAGTWNSPDTTVSLFADATGVNFKLLPTTRNIPAQSDLLFAAVTESLPTTEGAATGPWTRFDPAGGTMTTIGAPTVTHMNNILCVSNRFERDGFHVDNIPQGNAIPMNGGTMVVACRPYLYSPGSAYQCLVSVLLGQFELCVQRDTLDVQIGRLGQTGPNIDTGVRLPSGQVTVLSLVVQPTGEIALYTNSTPVWSTATLGDFTSLTAQTWYATDISVGHGWNGDGWSAFNGDIGDVFVYTKALSDADRHTLESDLGTKFGIPIPTYAAVSGLVTDGGVPVEGVIVKATQTANPANVSVSAPTPADGSYSLECVVGQQYQLSATSLPAGRAVTNAPAPFTPANTAPITGKNLLLGPDPDFDPALLFSTRSSAYVTGAGWPAVTPIGRVLTRMGNPTTRTINAQQWVNNHANGDGFTFTNVGWGPPAGTLAFNGGSIVAACRPIYIGTANNYQPLVSVLLDRFMIDVRGADGRLRVRRGGVISATACNIPNGQITTISAVVQPTGQFAIYTNGVMALTNTTTFDFTTLTPTVNYGTDVNVGKGWNGDAWSSFNGDIGDVYVYTVAVDNAKRAALEASLMAKYGTAPVYTIISTAGVGGGITPAGTNAAPLATDKTFTITNDFRYVVGDVLVDSASVGPVATYTFSNVTASHTIAAAFTARPTQVVSGKVTDGTAGIMGAKVYFKQGTNAYFNPLLTTTTTDTAGNYSIVVPTGNWYVSASANGYDWSGDSTFTVAGTPVTVPNIVLTANPNWDMLFASTVDSLGSIAAGASTGNRATVYPTGGMLNMLGTPTVITVDTTNWEQNIYAEGDGYRFVPPNVAGFVVGGSYQAPIPANGVSIVAVVQPSYIGVGGEARGEVVDLFYSELFLAVSHSATLEGQVIVDWRGYSTTNTGYIIPNGQKTILSLVVQPNGAMKLYANGAQVWSGARAVDYTTLQQTGLSGGAKTICIGRNDYDGWSTFSGNIGDVYLYRSAIPDAKRQGLENTLCTKFGITPAGPPEFPPSGLTLPGGTPTFTIPNTVAGMTYTLYYADSLLDTPVWTPLTGTGTMVSPGGTIQLSDPTPAGSLPLERFYRLVRQ